MNKKIRVLVFPCGSENGLEIHSSLKYVLNIELIGLTGKDDHGQFVYKNIISDFPYLGSTNFISELNRIIDEYLIDIILPTHEDVVVKLAENKDQINCVIPLAGLEQAVVCRSKSATYKLFENYKFCPKVYTEFEEDMDFPVFCKPDKGQGGKGAYKVNEKRELPSLGNNFDMVLTEFLPGDEYTVDCFSDKNHTLRFVGPRSRSRTFGGISTNSRTVPLSNEFLEIAETINTIMKMRGLWFFQLKRDNDGELKLLEISLRTAGTMNLTRCLGVNLPLLSIYDYLEYDIEILVNKFKIELDRCFFNKYSIEYYYKTIYIDFDDTIISNSKVNPFIMLFLYNQINLNKKIVLLTKHLQNIETTMLLYKISTKIFDEIIVVPNNMPKSSFIKDNEEAIFIDNSYKERAEVSHKIGLPTFDVDAIESLINWRE